jgi:hypothetical protein
MPSPATEYWSSTAPREAAVLATWADRGPLARAEIEAPARVADDVDGVLVGESRRVPVGGHDRHDDTLPARLSVSPIRTSAVASSTGRSNGLARGVGQLGTTDPVQPADLGHSVH